jgi:uncharacterized protein
MDHAAAARAGDEELRAPCFAADAMLGRLARWLRVLGYDTWYDAGVADPALVQLANDEDRVLLTLDRHLLRELRPLRAIELRQEAPLLQLRQIVGTLQLTPPAELFTRCLLCNALLDEMAHGEAAPLLPEGVQEIPGPVRRCPCCARLYWDGSHVRRMRTALDRVLPGWGFTS